MSDHKHNALVIVPTYNERDNLPGIVEALGKLSVDLLVVDDNSPDGTGKLADELAAVEDLQQRIDALLQQHPALPGSDSSE